MLSEDGDLYPQPKVKLAKSKNWNQRHIRSAVTQGILQGESVDTIAKRLRRGAATMSKGTAMRMAITSVTGAENAGRVHTYRYDRDVLGIDVRKEWLSASDAIDSTVILYNNLLTLEEPSKLPEGKEYSDYLNPESRIVLEGCKLEPSLADAKPGEKFQFVRTGYFCVDTKEPGVFNRTVTLKDGFKPAK